MASWSALCAASLVVACPLLARALAAPARDFDVVRAASGGRGPRVALIGGNPGVARFYEKFARNLAASIDGDVAVVGLRGFLDGRRASLAWWFDAAAWCVGFERGCFSVDEQIEHARVCLADEAAACEREGRELVVVAHSIGGYFSLKALGAGRSTYACLVSPYLENNEGDAKFRGLRGAMCHPLAPVLVVAAAACAGLLGLLPKFVRRAALRAAGQTDGMDSAHENVAVESMCAFSTAFTMAALGRSEMRRLATPYDGPWPETLVVFDEPADCWCPAAGPLIDRATAGGASVVTARDTPHAFSTRSDASGRVLRIVADAISKRPG